MVIQKQDKDKTSLKGIKNFIKKVDIKVISTFFYRFETHVRKEKKIIYGR